MTVTNLKEAGSKIRACIFFFTFIGSPGDFKYAEFLKILNSCILPLIYDIFITDMNFDNCIIDTR